MGNEFADDELCRDVWFFASKHTHVGCERDRDELVEVIGTSVKVNCFEM